MSPSLPAAVNLEQLRNQAKDLLRAHRAGQPAAVDRMTAGHPRPSESIKLADAQLVVAREYGFPSWPKLHAYVQRVQDHGPQLQHAFEDDFEYYAERAGGLLASAKDGTATATEVFRRWSAPLTERGAREVVASEHGFATWAGLRRHVASLAVSGEPFIRAFRAITARDFDALGTELDRFPELVTARGTNGNDLLGLASSTCDERLVAMLIERGAPAERGNSHGWTALHQAGYSDLPHMAQVLLDAGAPVDVSARGDGGTPLVQALFWGNRTVAALLAKRGIVPRNLRTAAGLDDVELIIELLPAAGRPTAQAGAHRAFYRPHGGFPAWRPSDDRHEIVDEAVCWAARNDSVRALDLLHERGASLEADVYRGTPLIWAASTGAVRAVRRLIERGADPNRRTTFGGPSHGEGITALHLAAQSGQLEVITALLEAGADPTVRDRLYDSTPAGWAEHGGNAEARALLP